MTKARSAAVCSISSGGGQVAPAMLALILAVERDRAVEGGLREPLEELGPGDDPVAERHLEVVPDGLGLAGLGLPGEVLDGEHAEVGGEQLEALPPAAVAPLDGRVAGVEIGGDPVRVAVAHQRPDHGGLAVDVAGAAVVVDAQRDVIGLGQLLQPVELATGLVDRLAEVAPLGDGPVAELDLADVVVRGRRQGRLGVRGARAGDRRRDHRDGQPLAVRVGHGLRQVDADPLGDDVPPRPDRQVEPVEPQRLDPPRRLGDRELLQVLREHDQGHRVTSSRDRAIGGRSDSMRLAEPPGGRVRGQVVDHVARGPGRSPLASRRRTAPGTRAVL